jgi:hypothetical protein
MSQYSKTRINFQKVELAQAKGYPHPPTNNELETRHENAHRTSWELCKLSTLNTEASHLLIK